MQQGSKEWLDYRSTRMGSSDAPVLMGVSPYKNIYDLYLEKKGEREASQPEKFVTDKGHLYEDMARLNLEKITGLIWKPEVFKSEENEQWISSVDGFCESDLLLWECKYVGKEKYNAAINPLHTLRERVSEQYYPQVIHHHLITGGMNGYFTVVVDNKVFPKIEEGKLEFFHMKYSLSKEDIDYMNETYKPELKHFTDMLKEGRPPKGIGETAQFITVKDTKLEKLIKEYKKEKDKSDPILERINKLKESIFENAMSYNSKIIIDDKKISVSTSLPKKFIDWEFLVKDNPKILKGIEIKDYERHTNPRTTKKITIPKD